MTGIVDDDIQPTRLFEHLGNSGCDGSIRNDIELDRTEIDIVVPRECCDIGNRVGVAAHRIADASIDDVPVLGERTGGESAEAAGRSGYDDDLLFHCSVPSNSGW